MPSTSSQFIAAPYATGRSGTDDRKSDAVAAGGDPVEVRYAPATASLVMPKDTLGVALRASAPGGVTWPPVLHWRGAVAID